MNIASFDIFDTTLIRKCGKPENIFYLLAHRLYPNDEAKREDFLLWRKKAEGAARRLAPGKEVTIDDIYSLESAKSFGEYGKKELIDAEMSVEAEQLIANPEIREVINRKREEGFAICFISDMYMPGAFLRRVLEREGCIRKDEEVYVSCEYNARKSNGALYRILREELKPAKWMHFGDHPVSDVKMARKNGVKGIKVDTLFNSAETNAIQPASERLHCESSVLAGYSRAARIKFGNACASLAADFIAPAYISYVHWILERCREQGIKRLYFLSRDSYILQRIAEELPHEGIELRYLFVSRKSLLLPYMQGATAAKFMAVQDKNTIIGKSVSALLSSLGTSAEELSDKCGITFNFGRITGKNEETLFLNAIFGEGSRYLPILEERAKERRTILNEYFAQESVFGSDATAMVDVGWLGTTRLMMNSILKEEGRSETLFFYYGVRRDVLGSNCGAYRTFYRPEQLSTEGTTLIENYFSASPYPSTIGYRKDKSGIVPVFPEGCAYKENDITRNNIEAAKWLCKEITGSPVPLKEYFWQWGKNAVEEILKLRKDIDISPMLNAAEFDEASFMRKLSAKELFSIVCLGGRATAFDKGSLRITCGRHLFPALNSIAVFTGNIRRRLYHKLCK